MDQHTKSQRTRAKNGRVIDDLTNFTNLSFIWQRYPSAKFSELGRPNYTEVGGCEKIITTSNVVFILRNVAQFLNESATKATVVKIEAQFCTVHIPRFKNWGKGGQLFESRFQVQRI